MGWIVELEISHLRFAIGGEHYYGTIRCRTKTVNGILHGGYNKDKLGEHPVHNRKIDVKRPLTSAKEIAYLNKKDNEGYAGCEYYYQKGELISRFNSPEDIPEYAIKLFNEMFNPEEDILVQGIRKYHEHYIVLAGNAEAMEALNGQDETFQRKWLWENGFEGT